jgi:hypothetical protein
MGMDAWSPYGHQQGDDYGGFMKGLDDLAQATQIASARPKKGTYRTPQRLECALPIGL